GSSPPLILRLFFHDPATTEIYTLSLHDALPISFSTDAAATPTRSRPPGWPRKSTTRSPRSAVRKPRSSSWTSMATPRPFNRSPRSEEHTSELQSRENLVCRLLLEKKKKQKKSPT